MNGNNAPIDSKGSERINRDYNDANTNYLRLLYLVNRSIFKLSSKAPGSNEVTPKSPEDSRVILKELFKNKTIDELCLDTYKLILNSNCPRYTNQEFAHFVAEKGFVQVLVSPGGIFEVQALNPTDDKLRNLDESDDQLCSEEEEYSNHDYVPIILEVDSFYCDRVDAVIKEPCKFLCIDRYPLYFNDYAIHYFVEIKPLMFRKDPSLNELNNILYECISAVFSIQDDFYSGFKGYKNKHSKLHKTLPFSNALLEGFKKLLLSGNLVAFGDAIARLDDKVIEDFPEENLQKRFFLEKELSYIVVAPQALSGHFRCIAAVIQLLCDKDILSVQHLRWNVFCIIYNKEDAYKSIPDVSLPRPVQWKFPIFPDSFSNTNAEAAQNNEQLAQPIEQNRNVMATSSKRRDNPCKTSYNSKNSKNKNGRKATTIIIEKYAEPPQKSTPPHVAKNPLELMSLIIGASISLGAVIGKIVEAIHGKAINLRSQGIICATSLLIVICSFAFLDITQEKQYPQHLDQKSNKSTKITNEAQGKQSDLKQPSTAIEEVNAKQESKGASK